MSDILDIHTHKSPPQPEGIVSIRLCYPDADQEGILPQQLYSAGIHPWDVPLHDLENTRTMLNSYASRPEIVAIGECGVDLKYGGPMFRQLEVFRIQIELSEQLKKPVIVHDVKGDDIICGLRRDLRPTQPWCIHGFRGKPAAAAALLRSGCYLSFGEKFNSDTLIAMPEDRILAETDESTQTIEEIIARMSEVRGVDLTQTIKDNSKKFCNFVS